LFSQTIAALEKFDNPHEFERMCADILNASGYKNVVLMAPRGGSDGGKDITFNADSSGKGLACATLQKDIDAKFKEDFSKRTVGEFSLYILFCTAYLTASQKQKFAQYCADNLQAELVIYDIEALRSLLDSALLPVREKYLQIVSDKEETNIKSLSTGETKNAQSASQGYLYDVALSFAGEDRVHAEALAEALRRYGISVFYDKYEKTTLWGKDLYIHLSDLYQNKARYCVMFFSEHYVAKTWTKHELRAAQARAFTEQQEYILPIRLDETEIPGILPTTAYLTWEQETVESIVQAILKKLGNTSRKSVKSWLRESEEYSEKGLYAKALIACEQALQIDPYNSDSYYDYGWILRKLERYKEALIAFEQAIQFDTKDDVTFTLDLYRQKGYTLEDLKRYEEALTMYEQIMQREKAEAASSQHHYYESYGDLCNIGDALLGLERYGDALAVYEQAVQIALNSTSSYDRRRIRALSNKGYTLYLLDRYEEALVICEQVIQLTPKDAYTYRLKGDILDELKRDEEAIVFFEKAVELDPKDVYAFRRKADLLYQHKRYEEALAVCEQAVQLDAADANIHAAKSNILVALGHIEAAHNEYMLATQLGYSE